MFSSTAVLPFAVIPALFVIAVIIMVILKRRHKAAGGDSLPRQPDDTEETASKRLFMEQMQRDMQIHQDAVNQEIMRQTTDFTHQNNGMP